MRIMDYLSSKQFRVKCLLPVLLLALSQLLACGQVFFGTVSKPDGAMSVTGTVSIVQLTVIDDNGGTSVTVTAVTLINAGNATTFNFCGDQRIQFPVHQFVRAHFTPGSTCSNVILVIFV
jgi:hypothetical protein